MITDPLTKVMDPEQLIHVMNTGFCNIEQPIAPIEKKRRKQQQRQEESPDESITDSIN